MWAFMMVHELPYDDPERLRSRLRMRYPIAVDRAIGGGRLPNVRLQRALAGGTGRRLDRFLSFAHWVWFFEPHVALLYLDRHPDRFPRAGAAPRGGLRQRLRVYFAVPTAPPWWASQRA